MLSKNVAIVTGATRGIGRAIVERLSKEGMSCIMVGSRIESFEPMSKNPPTLLNQEQWHRGLAIDFAQWPKWIDENQFRGIHFSEKMESNEHQAVTGSWPLLKLEPGYELALLVNVAGITQASPSVLCSPLEMQKLMNINFFSAVSMCNAALRSMIRSRKRQSRAPCILNVSSVLGESSVDPVAGTSVYSATKAALAQYSRVLAAEVAGTGIRVHCVSPSLVPDTDMIQNLNDQARERLFAHFGDKPDTHIQTKDEIAAKVWQLYEES
ncbi:LAFA_0C07162g1_1 [Lachancea sp. 'fantastica']|nr:LAFA_0C07162g1_1 [Lachancea sp. 'fantastica']